MRFVDFRSTRPDGTHPETVGTSFTFLGFCHVWGKSRKGKNMVWQVTAKKRYARALVAVSDWCRENRHKSIREQHDHLTAMMRGHYAYFGITGNARRLLVRQSSRAHLAEVAIATGSKGQVPMEPPRGNPEAPSSPFSQDRPSVHLCERSSPVRNRMLEIGTYGSVRMETSSPTRRLLNEALHIALPLALLGLNAASARLSSSAANRLG
jgi:hypothetical protein